MLYVWDVTCEIARARAIECTGERERERERERKKEGVSEFTNCIVTSSLLNDFSSFPQEKRNLSQRKCLPGFTIEHPCQHSRLYF